MKSTTMYRMSKIVNQTTTVPVKRALSTSAAAVSTFHQLISRQSVDSHDNELLFYHSPMTRVLHIELNRPHKLNALSLRQVKYLSRLFSVIDKVSDDVCSSVVVTGKGEKAFCAGGDIKSLTTDPNNEELCQNFFAYEYCADLLINTLRQPFISIWNGLVLGGGVGISVHGRYRIATDTTTFAMPETSIGLFPDVVHFAGASYFLSRIPNGIGLYLGLMGSRLNAADLIELNLASHYIPLEQIPCLMKGVLTGEIQNNKSLMTSSHDFAKPFSKDNVEQLLKLLAVEPTMKPSLSSELLQNIEKYFDGVESLEELLLRLNTGLFQYDKFATETLSRLNTLCPLSCGVWIEQHRRGKTKDLRECFEMEYKLCQSMCFNDGHNFKEGVRAILIDRDFKPQWEPKQLSELKSHTVKSHFHWEKARSLNEFHEQIFQDAPL